MQCFHCGREVRETCHTQKGYQVDYALLHTGSTEWVWVQDPKENMPPHHVLRVSEPVDIVTCTDCYADARIKKRLEDDFNGLASMLGKKQSEKPEKEPKLRG